MYEIDKDSMQKNKKPLNVLISCFACGPNWGSEVGMGWNWVIHLSQHCQLYVVSESGFQRDIDERIPQLDLKYMPNFYYIDIGQKGRDLFWKQGSFKFYQYYKKWQYRAYELALKIISSDKIDIIHQLNMTGFREPGYLWRIETIPFVWGPVAGFGQIPWAFILKMNWRNKLFWSTKRLLNSLQMVTLKRVAKTADRADLIISATRDSSEYVKKLYHRNSIIINDSGTKSASEFCYKQKVNNKALQLIWVGVINARKSLDIALKALTLVNDSISYKLHIYGSGPDEKYCKELGIKLNISEHLCWHGRVVHEVVLDEMKRSDLLLFTSLMEGTPNVVNEALSAGLPVICHDSCGHGVCVNDKSGLKVTLKNPKTSINEFGANIKFLFDHPLELARLSKGAIERAQDLTWGKKAKQMYEQYLNVYEKNNSKPA